MACFHDREDLGWGDQAPPSGPTSPDFLLSYLGGTAIFGGHGAVGAGPDFRDAESVQPSDLSVPAGVGRPKDSNLAK